MIKKRVSVTLPDSLRNLSNYLFTGCTALKTVVLPKNLKTIDYCAFNGCEVLSSITIPDTVISVGRGAFASCTSLKEIVFPESVAFIGGYSGGSSMSAVVTVLNPNCEIDCQTGRSASYPYYFGNIIRGYEGSTAQSCASTARITFISLGKSETYDKGDVNHDHKVNVTDIIIFQKWILGKGDMTYLQEADLDADHVADIFDFALLKQKVISQK